MIWIKGWGKKSCNESGENGPLNFYALFFFWVKELDRWNEPVCSKKPVNRGWRKPPEVAGWETCVLEARGSNQIGDINIRKALSKGNPNNYRSRLDSTEHCPVRGELCAPCTPRRWEWGVWVSRPSLRSGRSCCCRPTPGLWAVGKILVLVYPLLHLEHCPLCPAWVRIGCRTELTAAPGCSAGACTWWG